MKNGHLTIACLLLCVSLNLFGAGKPKATPPVPDMTKGGKMDNALNWTIGSTGVRAWIYRYKNSTDMSRQILVTKVHRGSPADGALQKGDVILGVGDKLFSSDCRRAISAAVTEAEEDSKLELIRWRDGKQSTVTLKLRVMGTFAKTAPYNCPKSKKIIELAVAALKQDGLDNGNKNPIDGDGIPGVVNAMGLMATGRADVMPIVKAKMTQIAEKPYDGYKWGHGWGLVALAEYYLLTGDKSVLPAIERYSVQTARGQSIAGTWGHGFAAQDHVLGGYGAMNQISITHTIGLILATKCGVKAPVVRDAAAKSIRFFEYYVGKGSVPYGAHEAGAQHGPDDNGKSSGTGIAFNMYGHKKGATFFSKHGVYDFSRIEIGHASNFFHLPWQGMASAQLGPDAAAAHFRNCQWYYELLRDWRGKFRHHEDPNHGEPNKYWDATGARLLFFCLPLKKLHLTGKGGYLPDPVRGKELEAIVESGRHDRKYNTLSNEQLLKRLGDWCHATRWRAAQELAKRDGDWCSHAIKMYTKGTMDEKYGATRLFEALKDKSAPAVDPLIKNIQHNDMWLRIRTVYSLGAIGKPAVKAVPALLEAVKLEDAADIRNMHRRAIAMALFSKKNGLLADKAALAAIPKNKLIPALKILLRTEEGQAVTSLQHPLKQLSFDDLQPLWPEIVYRVEHRLSENVMFANMQTACLDLLAKHKVEEGLRLAGYFVNTQNGWGSGRRNKNTLNALLKYGRHAERTFFPLQAYLEKNIGFNPQLQAFKEAVRESKETPELVSISKWLGDYEIGSHYEKLLTMRELRKKVAEDNLATYWTTYEKLQELLKVKPDWKVETKAILADMQAIPRAAEIIQVHLEIAEIKQKVIEKKMPREEAIKKLVAYRDKYDINHCGPNLVYWFSLMWSDRLKSGRNLK